MKGTLPIVKNAQGQPPLEEAEARLYPNVPYEAYTKEMRFAAYDLAKQIYHEKTGHLIPS